MDNELMELRRRVAALEAATAAAARRGRAVWATAAGAALVVLAATVTLAQAAGAPPPLPNPSRVPAPFEVVDGKGRAIFRVQMSASGDGAAILYDDAGSECAIIGHSPQKPLFQVWKNGVLRGGMGYSGAGNGLLVLDGPGQSSTQVVGGGGFYLNNAEGQDVATIAFDAGSNGFAQVMNRAGAVMSEMAVAGTGSSGRVSVSVPGEIRVLMGVLENGKGDVCANGAGGRQACLSGLAAKALTPY